MHFDFANWLILALYAVAAYFYLRDFREAKPDSRQAAHRWYAIAVAAHCGWFAWFSIQNGRIPVANVSEALSTFVLMVMLTYGILEWRTRERSMGAFILPVGIALMLMAGLTFTAEPEISDILTEVLFEIHVLAMLLGYAGFTVSFIASLLHYLLSRELRNVEVSVFYSRLPSIAFFERISNRSVDLGLVFSLLGFGLGWYFARGVWGSNIFQDPKFAAALLTLLIYAIHFVTRRLVNWRGERSALVSIIGFSWLLFSFVVISTLFTRVHTFV